MKKLLFVCAMSLLTALGQPVSGQTQIYLAKGEKIKKNNNLYGIFFNNEWELPCKYDRLEILGPKNNLFAFHGTKVDIYDNGYGKKLLQADLPVQHLDAYNSLAGTGINPIFSAGKWGYSNNYENIAPRYDSLFNLCLENGLFTDCTTLIGVALGDSMGCLGGGKILFFEKGFNKIKYWYTGGDKGSYLITCTHNSGMEVSFKYHDINLKPNGFRDLKYAETKNAAGLKGFASYGVFVEPRYTDIVYKSSPIPYYECKLPDGSTEYRNGAALMAEKDVTEMKRKEQQILLDQQKQKELESKYASLGLPIEIKTKKHAANAYPGWSDIFKNSESQDWLVRADYGSKKPSEIFKEAPNGWLKSAWHVYPIHLKFEEIKDYSFEKAKQSLVDWAARRTKWAREKIKPLEELVSLPDGRKGQILFYVCPDMTGMIDGNNLHCELSIESPENKNNIIQYTIIIDGGCPDLPSNEAEAWKDYFKQVLLTIRPI